MDVGCGTGKYLALMQHLGWRVLGIEPHLAAAQIARQKGIEVYNCRIEDARLPDASVDEVALIHVIEHLSDPLATINECFRILRKGGRLVLRTPNAESLAHRVFKQNTFHLEVPRHLFLFCPRSMRLLFEKSNFKAARVKSWPMSADYFYDTSAIIAKKGRLDLRKTKPQKGRVFFLLRETLLCALKQECGELVDAVAIKQ